MCPQSLPSIANTALSFRRGRGGADGVGLNMEEIIFKPPTILPRGWEMFDENIDGYRYVNQTERQTVIISWSKELDGKMWLHFSMACAGRVPSWEELRNAKEIFMGTESKAIQVIPPRSQYVNINPRVLHLFVCLDGDPLPDFTGGGGTL